MMTKKPALGRGLSALLETAKTDITTKNIGENAAVVNSVSSIKVKQIETNPFQPRTNFEENALQELSDSIRQHGIIQPLTVRKVRKRARWVRNWAESCETLGGQM